MGFPYPSLYQAWRRIHNHRMSAWCSDWLIRTAARIKVSLATLDMSSWSDGPGCIPGMLPDADMMSLQGMTQEWGQGCCVQFCTSLPRKKGSRYERVQQRKPAHAEQLLDSSRSLRNGEYPSAVNPEEAERKVTALLEAGIDHFIDLTAEGELVPYSEIAREAGRRLGVEVVYERLPIADLGVPRSPEDMAGILDAAMESGGTVFVHCWGGRTGTVVGCWLVRHGCSGDEAFDRTAQWWREMEKANRHPRSPETTEQREYVLRWTDPYVDRPV